MSSHPVTISSKAARLDVILSFVRKECEARGVEYSPEMLINQQPSFYGEDAEDLIYAAAAKIGLPQEEVNRSFPYGAHFEPESNLTLWPFMLILRIFRRPVYHPLTAQAFAELLVNIQDAATGPHSVEPSHAGRA